MGSRGAKDNLTTLKMGEVNSSMEEGGAGTHHYQPDYQSGMVPIYGEKAYAKVEWSECC